MPYSQRYLFNAIPDTNHNANPTNPNRYSKGNPNPTNPTNPTNLPTLLTLILDIGLSNPRITEPSDYRYITVWTGCLYTGIKSMYIIVSFVVTVIVLVA